MATTWREISIAIHQVIVTYSFLKLLFTVKQKETFYALLHVYFQKNL